MIIYLLENKINNKRYVGQTTRSIDERLRDHCTEKRNRHISNAIKTYGIENFEITILCKCSSQEELNQKEIDYVKELNTMHPNGYNHRAGGNQNGICSDELRKKISLAKIGKPNLKRRGEIRTENQRVKISRGLGGKAIKATNLSTGEIKVYDTAHSTIKDGHNPSNVVSICKKNSYRTHSKGWKFEYVKENQANQNGSLENKDSKHVQRLEIETEKSE
jgi:group I intron endonuclease